MPSPKRSLSQSRVTTDRPLGSSDEARDVLARFRMPPAQPAPPRTLEQIESLVRAHTHYRGNCLNLIASENITSPAVMRLQTSDLSRRYGDYRGTDLKTRKYLGNRYIVQLEELVSGQMRELFGADHVDLRPVSGHIAGEAVLMAVCKPGDTVLELDSIGGGHRLAEKLNVASLINLKVAPLPFDGTRFNVDVDRCRELIRRLRPKVVVLGSSNFLFPHPVADIRGILDELPESWLLYDASHVAGLIAGGSFQRPLEEGAHAMVASTHKTFGGPQGGVVLTNDRNLAERIGTAIHPGLVTNHHLQRLPGTGVACLEWMEFGRDYADAIVQNARRLGQALTRHGLEVVHHDGRCTDSHTVLVPVVGPTKASEAALMLEAAGIITGATVLPEVWGRSGIRLGLQELTRRGLTPEDAETVGAYVAALLQGQVTPADCLVEIRKLARQLSCCLFGFE